MENPQYIGVKERKKLVNKEKLIEMIETELVKADQAQNDVAFDKHIYAIHTLTALYTNTDDRAKSSSRDITHTAVQTNTSTKQATSSQAVTDEEIRLMGGKVSPSKTTTTNARMVTDDEIGNGESLFDF